MFYIFNDLKLEMRQAAEEGKPLKDYKDRTDKILSSGVSDSEKNRLAGNIFDDIEKEKTREAGDGYQYFEPSDMEEITALRNSKLGRKREKPDNNELYDKIYGAWLGRCAGCLLGKPIEGWMLQRITGLLSETGNEPLAHYISYDVTEEIRDRYKMSEKGAWIDRVKRMPEDDDLNYTVLALKIVETYGKDFTSLDVAESWLNYLPALHTFTAERAAYRNFLNGIFPPYSASHRNPYREWIGAQIRGDFFGYINPGDPERAAEMAFRDASISHVKNGIYGEMFMAAMLAEAFAGTDIQRIIGAGLSQIPPKSRMSEIIRTAMHWKEQNCSIEEVKKKFHTLYDENIKHHWCHVLSNAMIVTVALLYGEGNFERTITNSVIFGFDTDCNGATAGSIAGAINGAVHMNIYKTRRKKISFYINKITFIFIFLHIYIHYFIIIYRYKMLLQNLIF